VAAVHPLRITKNLTIPAAELSTTFARAGGPGGQNVNKVATKVVLRFCVRASGSLSEAQRARILERCGHRITSHGEIVIHAARYRDRMRNLEDAHARLAELLRGALAPRRARKATRPTRAARERRLGAKRRRSELKRQRGEHGE
jgi:ribosome-associated protein